MTIILTGIHWNRNSTRWSTLSGYIQWRNLWVNYKQEKSFRRSRSFEKVRTTIYFWHDGKKNLGSKMRLRQWKTVLKIQTLLQLQVWCLWSVHYQLYEFRFLVARLSARITNVSMRFHFWSYRNKPLLGRVQYAASLRALNLFKLISEKIFFSQNFYWLNRTDL